MFILAFACFIVSESKFLCVSVFLYVLSLCASKSGYPIFCVHQCQHATLCLWLAFVCLSLCTLVFLCPSGVCMPQVLCVPLYLYPRVCVYQYLCGSVWSHCLCVPATLCSYICSSVCVLMIVYASVSVHVSGCLCFLVALCILFICMGKCLAVFQCPHISVYPRFLCPTVSVFWCLLFPFYVVVQYLHVLGPL